MRSKDLRQSECGSLAISQAAISIFDAKVPTRFIYPEKCVKEHSLRMSGTTGAEHYAHCQDWVDCERRMLLRSLREGRRETDRVSRVECWTRVWGRVMHSALCKTKGGLVDINLKINFKGI